MSIVLPQRMRQQPQSGAILDVGNPLLLGVTEIVLPTQGRTLVRGNAVTPTSLAAGTQIAGDRNGMAFSMSGGATEYYRPAPANGLFFVGQTECTIFVLRRSRDTTARASALFGYYVSGSQCVTAIAPYSDGNLYWDFDNEGTGRLYTPFAKQTVTEALVFTAGVQVGRQIWRDGQLLNSGATANPIGNIDGSDFGIGGAPGLHSDTDQIFLLGIVSRCWSGAEVREWTRNPWGIFRTARRIWLPSVAAPPPSSARPQVFVCT